MKEALAITKALADGNRLKILMALTPGELCVCQIVEFLELAPSTVSRHLHLLSEAGLIISRKDGRWVYCSLPGKEASPMVLKALRWVKESLCDDSSLASEIKTLRKIVSIPKEELCRIQAGR